MISRDDAPLLADLYQFTMMQGYWAEGMAERPACFELFFRTVPEKGGYCVAAGVEQALDQIVDLRFNARCVDYLASLQMFRQDFLDRLAETRFTGQVRALREGTPVFPREPILELTGPLIETQWFETLLLNLINFQTLIATKASRMTREARPAAIVEFGLRRAQGPDGGLSASRAAYLGGCVGASNTLAGALFGVPVFGTHAHSWVMSFSDEQSAFDAYADVFPKSTVLLIDTYDTLEHGLRHAITTARRMESRGEKLSAIRLDSGDLAYLSKACRRGLDEAGLGYVKILVSSDVDEYVIRDLKAQGAPIDLYGVGTRLATAFQEPALNGVYKLSAIQDGPTWRPTLKLSSNPAKTTIPGRKQIWRWERDGRFLGDCLALEEEGPPPRMIHPEFAYQSIDLPAGELRPLLETRIQQGRRTSPADPLTVARDRVQAELDRLPEEHQRLGNPHVYRVGLSERLWRLRQDLIDQWSQTTTK